MKRKEPHSKKMKVADLAPAEYNPRKISDAALAGLYASIERFGLGHPVIWNSRSERIVGGHQRLKALVAQGIEETDVVVVDLPKSEEKALNVALNNPAISGDFTDDLDALLLEIQGTEPDLFDDLLLDELLSSAFPETGGETAEDAVPAPPEQASSVRGEVYQLGAHRLLCGDSTNLADVERLMDGERAALFATDPPYVVKYTGADRPNKSGKDWSDRYHEVAIQDAEGFFRAVFTNALSVTRENAAWYCWYGHKNTVLLHRLWDELDVLCHQQLVWVKPSAVHTYVYWPWRHEPCLMGWRQGNKPPHDGDNSHEFTTVWECDWEGAVRIIGNEHPTQKPVELFARPMRKHTQPGDICFEPFAGSGSQIIAAEKMGRRSFAMEIEPIFCDVVRRRWAEYVHAQECDWQALTPPVASDGHSEEESSTPTAG